MWVCSGTHSDSKPRSSSARASGAGCMESVVKNITAPIFMAGNLLDGGLCAGLWWGRQGGCLYWLRLPLLMRSIPDAECCRSTSCWRTSRTIRGSRSRSDLWRRLLPARRRRRALATSRRDLARPMPGRSRAKRPGRLRAVNLRNQRNDLTAQAVNQAPQGFEIVIAEGVLESQI